METQIDGPVPFEAVVHIDDRGFFRSGSTPEFPPSVVKVSSALLCGPEGLMHMERRHTPEQIARKLREADRLLGEGMELPRGHEGAGGLRPTYHCWRAQLGRMKADDVKRLGEVERENAWLRRIVADHMREDVLMRTSCKSQKAGKSVSIQSLAG
jgi:putative transposase